MRYSSTHKEETRSKLMASSRAIAKQGGFEVSGVDELMRAIGLSGGAFYNHFPSKQALFAALVEEEANNSAQMLSLEEGAPPDALAKRVRSYLSTRHALHPESGCALPTLGPEIARATPEVRRTIERSVKQIQESWSDHLKDPDAAWGVLAQCVGALLLSRIVQSERTRKEILASSRRFLGESTGLESLR